MALGAYGLGTVGLGVYVAPEEQVTETLVQAGAIPNVKLDMPSLFYPNRKPVGKVKIDWNHPLSKSLLYNLSTDCTRDSVTDIATSKYTGIDYDIKNVGKILNRPSSAAGPYIALNRTFTFTADEAFSMFYTGKKTDTSSKGMPLGRGYGFRSYMWENEGSNFTAKSESQDAAQFTSASSFVFSEFHSVVLTSDGGGVANCTVSLYLNGVLIQALSGRTFDFIISRIMGGYPNNFEYYGYMRDFSIFGGCLSPEEAMSLHANPYQFLIPDRG